MASRARTHRLMGGAAGPKAVACLGEVGVEDRSEHLKQGLLDETVKDRRHPETAHFASGLGDEHPADRGRAVGACVETGADFGPVGVKPGTKFLGLHAVRAGSAGVCFDALERPGQVLAREEALEQTGRGGVRVGARRRWEETPLFAGSTRASPSASPQGPVFGVGCHHCFFRKFVKGPSLVRSALPGSSFFPAGTMASADFSLVSTGVAAFAVHSHPANVMTGHLSDPKETSLDKNDRFPPTAAAST